MADAAVDTATRGEDGLATPPQVERSVSDTRVRWACVACATLTIAVGVFVLTGWATGNLAWTYLHDGWPSIPPMSAVGLVAGGAALLLLARPDASRVRRGTGYALAALTALLGAVVIVEYATGTSLGLLERVLFSSAIEQVPSTAGVPGRPSPYLAAGLVIVGFALLVLDRRVARVRPADALALLAAGIALVGVVGYLLEASLPEAGEPRRFPLLSAAALLALSAGVLLSRRDGAMVRLFASGGSAGIVARRLLPVVLVLPPLMAILQVLGESHGWYDRLEGQSGRIVLTMATLLAVVAYTVASVRRSEQAREAAAEAERQSTRLVDLVFQSSPDMVVVANFDGWFVRTSPAGTAILGWTEEEMCSRPFVDFLHPADIGPTQETYAAQQERGEPVLRFENRYRTRDGGYRWLRWRAVTLLDERLIVGTARDVTEEKAQDLAILAQKADLEHANAELARSNDELEMFAYVASHDLSEPLRTIGGFVTLLGDEYGDAVDDTGREYMRYVVEGTTRMGQLIEDLLTFSRVGRVGAEVSPVDLDNVVSSICGPGGSMAPQLNGTVQVRDRLPVVLASQTEARQLLGNLLGNAVKFRRPDREPRVEISAEATSKMWCQVCVDDNGIGIEPEHRERIFKMFQRLHHRETYSGTGIGLAVCRKIVERYGGSIRVEDSPLGGTRFAFTLPLAQEGAE